MLLHDVDVHAVEIEEKIIEAAPLFSEVNYASYADPDLAIVLDDARNYIDVVDQSFDVIVTDVTNLKYKRNPYLYTREYFEIMGDALSEDGVAAAWLPVGGLSFNDLRTLIATFDSVFPHTTAWYFTQFPTHFIILVVTPGPTLVNMENLVTKMADIEHVRIGTDTRPAQTCAARITVSPVSKAMRPSSASMMLMGASP